MGSHQHVASCSMCGILGCVRTIRRLSNRSRLLCSTLRLPDTWYCHHPTRLYELQIQNGKGQMPAWEGNLEDDEIEAVANYVYATAGQNAW